MPRLLGNACSVIGCGARRSGSDTNQAGKVYAPVFRLASTGGRSWSQFGSLQGRGVQGNATFTRDKISIARLDMQILPPVHAVQRGQQACGVPLCTAPVTRQRHKGGRPTSGRIARPISVASRLRLQQTLHVQVGWFDSSLMSQLSFVPRPSTMIMSFLLSAQSYGTSHVTSHSLKVRSHQVWQKF